MGYQLWIQVLTVHKHEDWEQIFERSPSVLELRCLDNAFTSETPKKILVQFKCLRALYIDAHGDIIRRESGQFAYRDLFKALPASLLRLEIAHAHGPDLRVIQTVRAHCPDLAVLRLGRCSMFNRIPPCAFWQEYPLDHDAYIAAIGTDDFAHSVAQELVSMHNLKALRIGVYFMHSNAVLAHRAYHVRGVPAPDGVDWQQALSVVENIPVPQPPARLDQNLLVKFYHQDAEPDFGPDSCAFCYESFEPSRGAEARANRIIKRLLPGLQIMEWMDWFSPSHRGVSQHAIGDLVPVPNVPP
ncbi:hypothetical protein RhiJN_02708 [Ceratobasidium sp. AG-Ba]|nr:hypothetical protein RhiJN_02708 [Ceratobasidium sp. AG-Ba]QRW03611.1 hypothetical protein RhiLY_02610 [Ceratobasidium sp. AG-Ba]